MGVSLTRTVTFHARHRYRVPTWSEAENQARFGWTGAAPGHSHAYQCAVTVTGPLDPVLHAVMDLGALDRILDEEVLTLDGCHLNETLPAFAYGEALPTCEALAAYFFRRIRPRLPAGVELERVRVAEDATLHADCTGLP